MSLTIRPKNLLCFAPEERFVLLWLWVYHIKPSDFFYKAFFCAYWSFHTIYQFKWAFIMPMTFIIFIFRWSWVWVHFLELLLFSIPFSISLTTFFIFERDSRVTFLPPLWQLWKVLGLFFFSFVAYWNWCVHCYWQCYVATKTPCFFKQLVTFLFIHPKQWFHRVRVIG